MLKRVAKILLRSVRRVDTVARFGGEEFVVLLPKTKRGKAEEVAEKLRKSIERAVFSNPDGNPKNVKVTISVGVANFPEHARTKEDLLDLADQALYVAKEHGRNRVATP